MNTRFKKSLPKGFTLLELLVVVAIIGILGAIAAVSFGNARSKARDTKRIGDMRSVVSALGVFYDEAGGYPATLTANTKVECPGAVAIVLPKDPGSLIYGYALSNVASSSALTTGCVPRDANNKGQTNYSITFELENTAPSLGGGTSCRAGPAGLKCGTTQPTAADVGG